MKKLLLEKFAANILKADVSKTILGGYGDEGDGGNGGNEGTKSDTSNCTIKHTGTWTSGDTVGDTTNDGDFYSSC